jgi:hypothetical protein
MKNITIIWNALWFVQNETLQIEFELLPILRNVYLCMPTKFKLLIRGSTNNNYKWFMNQ